MSWLVLAIYWAILAIRSWNISPIQCVSILEILQKYRQEIFYYFIVNISNKKAIFLQYWRFIGNVSKVSQCFYNSGISLQTVLMQCQYLINICISLKVFLTNEILVHHWAPIQTSKTILICYLGGNGKDIF